MRLAVHGGFDIRDAAKVDAALDYWLARLPITSVVHNCQISFDAAEAAIPFERRKKWGAPYLASRWAERRRIAEISEPPIAAEVKSLGRSADAAHNKRILDRHKPDAVLIFPGSDAADDLAAQARRRGIKVIEAA